MNQPASLIASAILVCLLLQPVAAQSSAVEPAGASPVKVTLYQDLVRFLVTDAESLRLELFDLMGAAVFDSGKVAGSRFDWLTLNQQGGAVESSLYAYRLTVKSKAGEDRRTYEGNLIIDRQQKNLPDAPSAEAGDAKKGGVQPHATGIYDVTATGGSYNIDTPLMGVGTASPLARLQVGGGTLAPSTSGATLLLEEGATTSLVLKSVAGGEMLLFQNGSGGLLGTVSNHSLSLRTNNQNRLFIDPAGRVGIGTNAPTATLTVNGTIEASGGMLMASVVNATSQFNINGTRVLSTSNGGNLFTGVGAGTANTTGAGNSFFGTSAGFTNTTGGSNAFFGHSAGLSNSSGSFNSFFGSSTGYANTTGSTNSFFGSGAGTFNTTGYSNSFFGESAGLFNQTGVENAFFGNSAGAFNSSGSRNSFYGKESGFSNTFGTNNSFFGRGAGYSNIAGSYNAFFGQEAGYTNVGGEGNSFFGSAAGGRNTNGFYNAFFGGLSGGKNTVGSHNSFFGVMAGITNTEGNFNTFIGAHAGDNNTTGSFNTAIGDSATVSTGGLSFATAIGSGAVVSASNTVVIGRNLDTVTVPGFLRLFSPGFAGSTPLCRNASQQISFCSSSQRYKSEIEAFRSGLALIEGLRPVSFNWRAGGERDLGLIAEEVAELEPLLVIRNDRGEVEGIKYDRINVALVNAIKELRAEKDAQMALLKAQNAGLSARLAALEKRMANPPAKARTSASRRKSSGRRGN